MLPLMQTLKHIAMNIDVDPLFDIPSELDMHTKNIIETVTSADYRNVPLALFHVCPKLRETKKKKKLLLFNCKSKEKFIGYLGRFF